LTFTPPQSQSSQDKTQDVTQDTTLDESDMY